MSESLKIWFPFCNWPLNFPTLLLLDIFTLLLVYEEYFQNTFAKY